MLGATGASWTPGMEGIDNTGMGGISMLGAERIFEAGLTPVPGAATGAGCGEGATSAICEGTGDDVDAGAAA